MWYKNICSASFSFVTIHACDRRTDRQTDRRSDRITTPKTALVYARAVKINEIEINYGKYSTGRSGVFVVVDFNFTQVLRTLRILIFKSFETCMGLRLCKQGAICSFEDLQLFKIKILRVLSTSVKRTTS